MLFFSFMKIFNATVTSKVLLQSGAAITNEGNFYYKIGQLFQIKLGQVLQIRTIITNRGIHT